MPAAATRFTGPAPCCSTPWARCRQSITTTRHMRPGLSTRTGTGSSSPAAAVSSSLEEYEHAAGAEREDLRGAHRLPAPPPTASTWSSPRAKARRAAWKWRWRTSRTRLTTSTHMQPAHRQATRENWAPSGRCSGTASRRSVPPRPCQGTASARRASTRAIFALLMLKNDFVCKSANIRNLDPDAEGVPIALERIDNAGLNTVMSNSFGFGGRTLRLFFRKFGRIDGVRVKILRISYSDPVAGGLVGSE